MCVAHGIVQSGFSGYRRLVTKKSLVQAERFSPRNPARYHIIDILNPVHFITAISAGRLIASVHLIYSWNLKFLPESVFSYIPYSVNLLRNIMLCSTAVSLSLNHGKFFRVMQLSSGKRVIMITKYERGG